MKGNKMTCNLVMAALLTGGIFAVGAENHTRAQDRSGFMTGGGRAESSGFMTGGGRSGYISSSGYTESDVTSSTNTYLENGGYLGSGGGRAENEESGTLLDSILGFFI